MIKILIQIQSMLCKRFTILSRVIFLTGINLKSSIIFQIIRQSSIMCKLLLNDLRFKSTDYVKSGKNK